MRPPDRTLAPRTLGDRGPSVTNLCFGTSSLGTGVDTSQGTAEERSGATLRAVFDGPISFLDTSNNYGAGVSERTIGRAIAESGLPPGFVVATKVDGDTASGRFDGERVRRSFGESQERLGLEFVPLLYLHDPHRFVDVDTALAPDGAVAALEELRSSGAVGSIGIAMGPLTDAGQYLDTGVFDVVLTHNRFTLLDRSADRLIDRASDDGIGVVNAAPFGGGMLSRGPRAVATYAYGAGNDAHRRGAEAMDAACRRAGIPLAAASLQFSLRDPRINSTVVGASSPQRVADILRSAQTHIPNELWDELEALAPAPETWIDD